MYTYIILNAINGLVLIVGTECVFCEAETKFPNNLD